MKSSLAFGLLLAALSVLNGCASFDNQPINAVQTAQQLENRRLNQPELQGFIAKLTGQTPSRWSLDTLTLAALYYHSDVALAQALADSADAAIITAKQRPNPSLSLSAMWISNLVSTVMPWILTTGLNIPIETAGKRDFRTDRAVQLSDAARLRVSDALWAVRARLRAAMLALYSEQENLKLAQQMLHIEQDIAEHLVQQLTAGVISRLELHHAQLGVQQAQLNVLSSEKRLAENRVALATAIGLPVTALNAVELDFSEFAAPADLAAIPSAKLRATALQNRADIRAALADYAAAQAGLQLAIAGQYPDIQVNPSYSWQKGENRWGLGGLTVPLPLFNQNQGAIAEAQAKRQEMAVRVEALQARILGDIDKALAGVSAVLKKWKTVAQQQTDAQENRRNVQALIQAGESDALALLAADALSATTEQSRLAVLVESWQSLAQLEDSLRYPLAAAAYLNKQLVSQ